MDFYQLMFGRSAPGIVPRRKQTRRDEAYHASRGLEMALRGAPNPIPAWAADTSAAARDEVVRRHEGRPPDDGVVYGPGAVGAVIPRVETDEHGVAIQEAPGRLFPRAPRVSVRDAAGVVRPFGDDFAAWVRADSSPHTDSGLMGQPSDEPVRFSWGEDTARHGEVALHDARPDRPRGALSPAAPEVRERRLPLGAEGGPTLVALGPEPNAPTQMVTFEPVAGVEEGFDSEQAWAEARAAARANARRTQTEIWADRIFTVVFGGQRRR